MELKPRPESISPTCSRSVADKLAPSDRQPRPDAQRRGRRRCDEFHRRSDARRADPFEPPVERHRLLGSGQPPSAWARSGAGGTHSVLGLGLRAAASSPNSRNRPSSASSLAPYQVAIADRDLAFPSSRASSSCMMARSRSCPRSTRARLSSAPFPIDGPASGQRSLGSRTPKRAGWPEPRCPC
jgi:hypothetical protein